jgi:hypothetical protein
VRDARLRRRPHPTATPDRDLVARDAPGPGVMFTAIALPLVAVGLLGP